MKRRALVAQTRAETLADDLRWPLRQVDRVQVAHLQLRPEPYRLLVGAIRDYAIFLLDREGHVLTWNPGAELINGDAQRLQQVSRDVVQVPQGSLYPALHRLENRGLLAADWKATETGREAKFYRLTRKGRKQLVAETASWRRLTEAMGIILRLSEEGAK